MCTFKSCQCLSSLDVDEKSKFMREIGLEKMGISKLIKEGYDLLGLETFFTSGKEESRAWTIKKKHSRSASRRCYSF